MSVGRSERVVGREAELTALGEWLARAGGDSGGVYVIAGEPGVGKSRLAAEAIAAHTHFPMLEQPAELAADVIAFTSTLPQPER